MKRYLIGLFVGLISIAFISCQLDDSGYSLDDAWVGFGILYESDDESLGYFIKLDDGDVIHPISSLVSLGAFDDSCRVLVNFTIIGDKADSTDFSEYYVKVNSMRDILMKGILDITEENEDSIGDDPVIVKNAWLSGNLLTFEIKYWGDNEIHYINLVKQPGELTADDQPIELELRHNEKNDERRLPYSGYVTFDLSAIKVAGLDSVRFKVKATDYDGQVYEDEGAYKYGGN